jgi:hypothetical protein
LCFSSANWKSVRNENRGRRPAKIIIDQMVFATIIAFNGMIEIVLLNDKINPNG